MTGKIKFYDQLKGFGFITSDNSPDTFCHRSALVGDGIPMTGDEVEFMAKPGPRGPKATAIKVVP